MNIFVLLELIGGLALFLYGMSLMGTGLEKSTGSKLKSLLERLTTTKLNGFLLGLLVTAIIQSSSATTVMVVGFVNSGIMTLKQAIHVIMGANVGTTVTAWVLSLSGLEGDSFFIKILKPSSFTPILALIGIIFYLIVKNRKKKDIGLILLGFSILIYGMESMSAAIKPLGEYPEFRNILLMFSNPILGVITGAMVTAVVQSSSASVGILQALSATGQLTVGAATPIILGQNIGTTITALLSSVGANKNARRAAIVHLYFNIIGTTVFLIIFSIVKSLFALPVFNQTTTPFTIAIVHTLFNLLSTATLLPLSGFLEKLAYRTIKDNEQKDESLLLDERLFQTPAIALNRCKNITKDMANLSRDSIKKALLLIENYNENEDNLVIEAEQKVDIYEDALGTYLVRLSNENLSEQDNLDSAKLLYLIGEFERISDYAVAIAGSAREMNEKKLIFSDSAQKELKVIMDAVSEIVDMAVFAFNDNNISLAMKVEPLEEVIDVLKSTLKKQHIQRLQKCDCTIELGFIFSDLITVLERVSDHCSNIAGCIIEMTHESMDFHNYYHKVKSETNSDFVKQFNDFSLKYKIE